MEQALGRWSAEEGSDFRAAAGLSEDRHVVRVTTEGGDVVAHPLKGGNQIQHSRIP